MTGEIPFRTRRVAVGAEPGRAPSAHPACETEFRSLARSQNEFGNEQYFRLPPAAKCGITQALCFPRPPTHPIRFLYKSTSTLKRYF